MSYYDFATLLNFARGMSTGEGFRTWTPEQARAVRERLARFLTDSARERARKTMNDKR
jgi:hypothetical protein